MRNHKLALRVLLTGLSMLLADCAATNAPPRWLSDPDQAASEAYGGWVTIETRTAKHSGELIAVETDTIFVADSVLTAVAKQDVVSARLTIYEARWMGGNVILGTGGAPEGLVQKLLTGRHGWKPLEHPGPLCGISR